jgi:hypothetical protein
VPRHDGAKVTELSSAGQGEPDVRNDINGHRGVDGHRERHAIPLVAVLIPKRFLSADDADSADKQSIEVPAGAELLWSEARCQKLAHARTG